jgi:hypothetical protein
MAVVQYNPFGDLKTLRPDDNRVVNAGSIIAVSYEARARGKLNHFLFSYLFFYFSGINILFNY